MNSLKNEKAKKEYEQYVNEITPKHNLPLQMGKAFVVGGLICVLGQAILNLCQNMFSMTSETAGSWCSLLLVGLSVLLTGLNLYQKIVKFAGAGALVPITGFANYAWPLRRSNTRKRARSWASDVRFSPSQDR